MSKTKKANRENLLKQLAKELNVLESDIENLDLSEGLNAFKLHSEYYDFDISEDGILIQGSIVKLKPVYTPTT